MRILTVNAGSTSLKLAIIVDGRLESTPASLAEALDHEAFDAIAHRIVHGGQRNHAVVVNGAVVRELRELVDLAPLHQPPALAALDTCLTRDPSVQNVACFDTAFHTSIPDTARTYAIPARFRDTVRQYGFHGLSYAWTTARIGALAPDAQRVLIAHLGGGQSLCGTVDGRSVATTMGFTPLDGLVMGTRCGALDPGVVTWLARHVGSADELDELLERESGLVALCGDSDMRAIHERIQRGDREAQFAFDVWRHSVTVHAGACVAATGGLDALVFTGGIGEHDPIARAAIADALGWLGVDIDRDANEHGAQDVTGTGAAVRTFVIEAREDLQLAAEAEALLAQGPLALSEEHDHPGGRGEDARE